MKIRLGCKVGIGLLILGLAYNVGAASSTDVLMEEGRTRAAKGDLEGAALVYHQALKLDKTNEEARRALAEIIVQGHIKDPYAEEADVLNPIMKEEKLSFNQPTTSNG